MREPDITGAWHYGAPAFVFLLLFFLSIFFSAAISIDRMTRVSTCRREVVIRVIDGKKRCLGGQIGDVQG